MTEEKSMECPFTWGINHERVKESKDFDEEMPDDADDEVEYPFTPLIDSIMHVYRWTVLNSLEKAQKEVDKTLRLWNNLDQRVLLDDGISVEVLQHVIKATQYHLYIKLERMEEAKKIMEEIRDSFTFGSREDLATIYGCKSMSWSVFGVRAKNATLLARTAVMINPNCSAWQYQLGKNLWSTRRERVYVLPSDEEIESFEKAYELSGNPYYGVRAILVLKEGKRYSEEDKLLQQIYQTQPKHPSIRLRLALCFLRKFDFAKAKDCLDYVETKIPASPMFLHYKGLYYEKRKKYKEAAAYFKKSADINNFAADIQYASCKLRMDQNFGYVAYLQSLLDKYDKTYKKQKLFLQIGLSYYVLHQDTENAVEYILEGIEKAPDNIQLFKNVFDVRASKPYNILRLLDQTLLPEYVKSSSKGLLVKKKNLDILNKINWSWSRDWSSI